MTKKQFNLSAADRAKDELRQKQHWEKYYEDCRKIYPCIREGNIPALQELEKQGVNISKDFMLGYAVSEGQTAMVKYLLDQGHNPNLEDAYALREAWLKKSQEIVELLLEHGARIEKNSLFAYQNEALVLLMNRYDGTSVRRSPTEMRAMEQAEKVKSIKP
jgi:hypothetical protein